MSLLVEEQLRAYFTDLDREQGVINVAAIAAASLSRSRHLTLDPGEPGVDQAVEVELDISPLEREETTNLKPSTLLLLAAAAVVLVAGFIFAIESGPDDSSPVISDEVPVSATPPPKAIPVTPQAIAAGFIEAINTGDADAVLAALTPDVALSEKYTGMTPEFEETDRAFFEQHLAWSIAQGTTFTSPECAATDDSSGTSVNVACEFGWLPAVESAVGDPPIPTELNLVVTPDGIDQLAFEYPADFGVDGFEPWLVLNHNEDSQGVESGDWNSVAEAQQGGTLRAQYAAEWAAELDANSG
jgi:hypothetical protein